MGSIIIHSFYLANSVEEKGFGFNFDILETNLINLAIIIGLLIYFAPGFLGKILNERRTKIETAIKDAQRRQKEAAIALAEQQQKLTQAQAEAERIRKTATQSAIAAKENILNKANEDIERMKATAAQDLNADLEKAQAELKRRIVALALSKAEAQIKNRLDESGQNRLIDHQLTTIGG